MTDTKARLPGFDVLRCLAILAVVSIHAGDVALRKNSYFPTPTPEAAFYYALSACLRFCVPAFLMMSAFLLESRRRKTGEEPAARWRRYALPLAVAQVFYTALSLLEARAVHHPVSPKHVLLCAITGQAYFHTWYLFVALAFVLAHRFLRRLADSVPFLLLAIGATAVYAATNGRIAALNTDNPATVMAQHLLMAMPYYVAGIWFAGKAEAVRRLPGSVAFGALFVGLAASCWYGIALHERGFYNPGAEILSISVFVLALRAQRPAASVVAYIGSYSLGIYLWHPLFLTAVRIPQGRFYRAAISPGITFAIMLLEIVVAVGGSLVLSRYIRPRGLAQ